MSLVFPQPRELPALLASTREVVEATVLKSSNNDAFFQVRIVRVLKGALKAGAEIEIRPAKYGLGCQVGEAIAKGLPAPSYAVPSLTGHAPPLAPGSTYVFLLEPNFELAAINGWCAASTSAEIERLLRS